LAFSSSILPWWSISHPLLIKANAPCAAMRREKGSISDPD
jgi:hypothetical protein